MKNQWFIFAAVAVTLMLSQIRVGAQTTSNVPEYLRVSAIVEVGNDRYIGIVDNRDGRSDYLRAGDNFLDYKIAAVYPDEQSVLLEREDDQFILYLKGDKTNIRPVGRDSIVVVKTEGDIIKEKQIARRIQELIQQAEDEARASGVDMGPDDAIRLHQPVTMEEGLKKMAESVGMPVPENMSTNRTREEFIRDVRKMQQQSAVDE